MPLPTNGGVDLDNHSQWNISENRFPADGNNIEKIKFFLKYAILAPSSHNTQPWIFRMTSDNTVELYADRTRALPVVDPEDRALTISCGAALFNLQLAISYFGYDYETRLLPHGNSHDLLATVNVANLQKTSPNKTTDDYIKKLFQSVTMRRTNRLRYDNREIPESIISKVKSIASSYKGKVWPYVAEQANEKGQLSNLVAEGDRIQMSNKSFRRELASWIHFNRSHSSDGMPGYAFGFNDVMSLMGPFVIRTFDTGKGQAAKDKELALGSPVLLVIGTDSDNAEDWLYTGLALSNILLYLKGEDVWCSYLNQPIEVPELRKRLGGLINEHEAGGKYPQILLRIGYGKDNNAAIKPTPRRNIEQVLY